MARGWMTGLLVVTAAATLAIGSVSLGGCGSSKADAPSQNGPEDEKDKIKKKFEKVTIRDKTFSLEVADRDATRVRGLGGRESIPDDGGMLFVFPRAESRAFVMRDCLVDIDIIFLDSVGRVTAFHTMKKEDPQTEDESDREYELRLKKYRSGRASKYVIELKAGSIEKFDPPLKNNEWLELDIEKLNKWAKDGLELDQKEARQRQAG